jgi:hypothetical protein
MTRSTHLEPTVQLRHLLGIFSLRYPYTLLHLLGLGLHILAHSNEFVDRSFEGVYEWFGIEGWRYNIRPSFARKRHNPRPELPLD